MLAAIFVASLWCQSGLGRRFFQRTRLAGDPRRTCTAAANTPARKSKPIATRDAEVCPS